MGRLIQSERDEVSGKAILACDGTTVTGPLDVAGPEFSIEAPPITHVSQTGYITVQSTSEDPTLVEICGGEPYVSLHERVVEVAEGSPGEIDFAAQQPGTYSVVARPVPPEYEPTSAQPLPEEAPGDCLRQTVYEFV